MRSKIITKKFAIGILCFGAICSFCFSAFAQQTKAQEKKEMNDKEKESPFACNLNALTAEQRRRIAALSKDLKPKIQQVSELPDGFAFRYAPESDTMRDIVEFISYERLCCPFFDFEVSVEREGGPLWLRLKGRKGVKEFIKIEFGL